MLHLKNLTQYTPVADKQKEIAEQYHAIFWQDESGDDWYQAITQCRPDTFKVKYLPNGVICAIDKDASAICPEGGSVIEMASLPDGVDTHGGWQFIDGSIVPRIYTLAELIAQAKQKKQGLLAEAAKAIAPLQDAVDIGEATPEEDVKLKIWKKFRVNVNRVDSTKLPVVFPLIPE
ncbi:MULTISPECIES: tail fiber assembly protein [Edwardsiella]|uniref:Tail fiber assembly protein n=2 Tax=Edwardsiella anguillarum TaxID=1821960 RepID=A0ABY8SBN2_9GAMM|nr:MULTISPECIES: tail fiber assembly protein [Edwardsiella]AIJ10517.1 putative tail fiber assembly protein [Edwardsiella anguillarum ET080813]AKR77994.1 tail fiber assembly protein [Edwardsiella sp. LADL05-105]KAB0587594.1 tail fiber assembly protein [Edwardsiella anguillarum]UOU77712.1 tail fiber assembly protein [Edwardsiella anguillarum]WHP82351.1 tail fiber assembly protein [Edwardsiella anguillarum]